MNKKEYKYYKQLVYSVMNRIAYNIDSDINLLNGILCVTKRNKYFNQLRLELNKNTDIHKCIYIYLLSINRIHK